ncbi:MAG: Na+:solute symporter [Candidatus Omnitrophica bacterium]|nr:Na+:solute symporter [Candidatus Omnitrophota bacterium]
MDGIALAPLDWAVIAVYGVASLWIGLLFTKRASQNLSEYFVAGRKLGWFLAGTSMVATSFAADTPLAIARIVRTQGFQGNWYWWSGLIGTTMAAFFFAQLWQRSKILTDVELVELRYGGKTAAGLRMFHACFRSVIANTITLAWVFLGMQKICTEVFGWPKLTAIVILVTLTLFYTTLSGMWGVAYTDLMQFIVAMIGVVMLAWIVVADVGGPAALAQKAVEAARVLHADPTLGSPVADPDQIIKFVPNFAGSDLAVFTFLVFIFINWWGGADGSGFLAQRLFSCKNGRHAVGALLWYNIWNYAIRAVPWVLVGLASLIYLPNLADPEMAYPKMMVMFLPVGFRGLMVAAMLAAFMSTVATHINWGASYLVNDLYKRFVVRRGSESHYVVVSKIMSVVVVLMGAYGAWRLNSVYRAWLFLSAMMAGGVLVPLLRWYWWRVSAKSELWSLVASFVISNALLLVPKIQTGEWYSIQVVLTIILCTVIWLVVTFLTKPVDKEVLLNFYRRARPPGWWGPIAKEAHVRWPGLTAQQFRVSNVICWLSGIATVYAAMMGLQWAFIGLFKEAIIAGVVMVVSAAILLKAVGYLDWSEQEDPVPLD